MHFQSGIRVSPKNFLKILSVLKSIVLKLLYPALLYNQTLNKSGLERLDSWHDVITQKMFQEIKDPKHPLHDLLAVATC